MIEFASLASLFAVSFIAATIFPLSSEALFIALLDQGRNLTTLLFWATLGNTLGACVNWWLGTLLHRELKKPKLLSWIKIEGEDIELAERWFNKFGKWSLLFAWAPLVGDALTVFAGVARVKLWQLILLAGVGKCARYLVVAGAFSALFPTPLN